MVWGGISYTDAIDLEGAEVAMDSKYYTNTLKEVLILAANNAMGDLQTLTHNNAPNHTGEHIRNRACDNDVHVLDWPARFPDLNVITNIWGVVVREVY